MNDKNDKAGSSRWMAELAVIWLVCAIWLVISKWAAIKGLGLPDTDDNLRLQQVRDWLGGQGWFDLRQHRMLPPVGADIHWSRLVDIPLAGLILLFKPFTSTAFAERAAVTIAPLLPLGVAMAALAVIVRRLVDPKAWFIGPLLLLFAQGTLAMMSPLRIDHHGWQLALLLVMVMGMMIRRPALGGLISGVALGLSLAIGIELLPYLGLTAGLIALLWVADRIEAPRAAVFGASAAGTTALALLLFVSPASRTLAICDALSIVHVELLTIGGAGLFLLAALPLQSRLARLAGIIALGLAVIGFAWLRHPQCLGDPSALIDPDARQLWLANVQEARPIYRQTVMVQVARLSLPWVGLIGLAIGMMRHRHDSALLLRWAAIGILAAFAVAFCYFQTRAAPAAQALSLAGATMLAWTLMQWSERLRTPLRALMLGGIFLLATGMGFQMATKALPAVKAASKIGKSGVANRKCALLPALRPLNAIPAGTMFTFLDLSPRLIVATHHSAITGPYHRNGRAIADVMKAFGGTSGEAHAIVTRHHADYVLICPGIGEATIYAKRAPKGFYSELAGGRAPDWLEAVPLPGGTPYRLWKVKS